ncbi:hypothetical protein CROQUDRAFT_93740 [Cronartium quercuum f. sp. fusiforme G11]|uniref:Uncharacterized protein n=1 Tax=Cronartium quercuum f. sp. fusiforme G11 TaxID=708437 RepID=A0A9P6NL00_9BASI|nr:hypothetical protein CROQUDRAFT_93740 [Cronartium quercuum f. sp. fusiforme G11]
MDLRGVVGRDHPHRVSHAKVPHDCGTAQGLRVEGRLGSGFHIIPLCSRLPPVPRTYRHSGTPPHPTGTRLSPIHQSSTFISYTQFLHLDPTKQACLTYTIL